MCRSGCHRRSETNGNAETGGWLSETFQQSSLKIRVFKSGAFSAFVHDHEIQAPIEDGKSDSSATPSVQLRVDSRKMRALDPEISVDKLAEIPQTIEGTAVLDVAHFPQISYLSTAIAKTGDARWEVRGNLNLHGKSQLVVAVFSLDGGHYRGSTSFKQTNFVISPIRIAGGTVKVKDEVENRIRYRSGSMRNTS